MLKNIKRVVLQEPDSNHNVRFYKLDEDMWLEIIDGQVSQFTASDETVLDTIEVWRLDNTNCLTFSYDEITLSDLH